MAADDDAEAAELTSNNPNIFIRDYCWVFFYLSIFLLCLISPLLAAFAQEVSNDSSQMCSFHYFDPWLENIFYYISTASAYFLSNVLSSHSGDLSREILS